MKNIDVDRLTILRARLDRVCQIKSNVWHEGYHRRALKVCIKILHEIHKEESKIQ